MLLRHSVTNLLSNAVKYSSDGAEILVHIHAATIQVLEALTVRSAGA